MDGKLVDLQGEKQEKEAEMKYIVPGIILLIVGAALAVFGYYMAQTAAGHQTLFGELFGSSAYKKAVGEEFIGYIVLFVGGALALVGLIMAVIGPLSSENRP